MIQRTRRLDSNGGHVGCSPKVCFGQKRAPWGNRFANKSSPFFDRTFSAFSNQLALIRLPESENSELRIVADCWRQGF